MLCTLGANPVEAAGYGWPYPDGTSPEVEEHPRSTRGAHEEHTRLTRYLLPTIRLAPRPRYAKCAGAMKRAYYRARRAGTTSITRTAICSGMLGFFVVPRLRKSLRRRQLLSTDSFQVRLCALVEAASRADARRAFRVSASRQTACPSRDRIGQRVCLWLATLPEAPSRPWPSRAGGQSLCAWSSSINSSGARWTLRPPLANRSQDLRHHFGLRLGAQAALAVDADTDGAGGHVAGADDQHGVDLGQLGLLDLAVDLDRKSDVEGKIVDV